MRRRARGQVCAALARESKAGVRPWAAGATECVGATTRMRWELAPSARVRRWRESVHVCVQAAGARAHGRRV